MTPGFIVNGRYELVRCIGAGGMGMVWEARSIERDERVAIKFLHADLIDNRRALIRFFREAIAAHEARRSKNIVTMIETGELDDGSPFLVMEYLEGVSLQQILLREAPMAPFRAADLVIQVCSGLTEVHGSGIIHRDLKPANIIVCRDERCHELVKLLDFGVAKFKVSPDKAATNLTTAGGVSGTPYYIAPERFSDDSQVDHRADIYALGVILYEALTGRLPFQAPALHALLVDILTGEPVPPRKVCVEIPSGLESITIKALARDPRDRFQAVDDFAEALYPFSSEGIFLS